VIASICLLSASALGLGALLLASEQLFSALKIVGALYLFYLAWQSWQQSRQPAVGAEVPQAAPVPRFRTLFGRAFGWARAIRKTFCSSPRFCRSSSARTTVLAAVAGDDCHLGRARPVCKLAYGLGAHGARYLRSGKAELVQPGQCRVVQWCGRCVPVEPLRAIEQAAAHSRGMQACRSAAGCDLLTLRQQKSPQCERAKDQRSYMRSRAVGQLLGGQLPR
jgi:hypothetical protein